MFKFVVFFSLLAIAAAGHLGLGSELVYSADLPSSSGYEYTHTIQAPDYTNHVSVSAPLNGLARAHLSPLVQTLYSAPLGYHQAW